MTETTAKNHAGNQRGKYQRTPYKDMKKVRKQAIIDFIGQFVKDNKISPTYNEIAEGIGYSYDSQGTIYPWVQELIKEGWIIKRFEGARTLRLPDPLPAKYYYRREDHFKLKGKKAK